MSSTRGYLFVFLLSFSSLVFLETEVAATTGDETPDQASSDGAQTVVSEAGAQIQSQPVLGVLAPPPFPPPGMSQFPPPGMPGQFGMPPPGFMPPGMNIPGMPDFQMQGRLPFPQHEGFPFQRPPQLDARPPLFMPGAAQNPFMFPGMPARPMFPGMPPHGGPPMVGNHPGAQMWPIASPNNPAEAVASEESIPKGDSENLAPNVEEGQLEGSKPLLADTGPPGDAPQASGEPQFPPGPGEPVVHGAGEGGFHGPGGEPRFHGPGGEPRFHGPGNEPRYHGHDEPPYRARGGGPMFHGRGAPGNPPFDQRRNAPYEGHWEPPYDRRREPPFEGRRRPSFEDRGQQAFDGGGGGGQRYDP